MIGTICTYNNSKRREEKQVESGLPKITNCKSCGARIFFAYSGGKYKPLDAEPVPCIDANDQIRATETLFTKGGVPFPAVTGDDIPDLADEFFYGYRSHFATCPEAREFRRKKRLESMAGQTSMFGGDAHE